MTTYHEAAIARAEEARTAAEAGKWNEAAVGYTKAAEFLASAAVGASCPSVAATHRDTEALMRESAVFCIRKRDGKEA